MGRRTLEEANKRFQARLNEREVILIDNDTDGIWELWARSDKPTDYRLMIDGESYKFVKAIPLPRRRHPNRSRDIRGKGPGRNHGEIPAMKLLCLKGTPKMGFVKNRAYAVVGIGKLPKEEKYHIAVRVVNEDGPVTLWAPMCFRNKLFDGQEIRLRRGSDPSVFARFRIQAD
jgi:hypothetical protein